MRSISATELAKMGKCEHLVAYGDNKKITADQKNRIIEGNKEHARFEADAGSYMTGKPSTTPQRSGLGLAVAALLAVIAFFAYLML